MATIPNLNTLRRGRGGPRLRGRSGRLDPSDGSNIQNARTADQVVQQTDHDANSSRLSAVELGYLKDDYAKAFSTPGDEPVRRYPLINRGTYVRTTAIDRLVLAFLQGNAARKQIVSLGAGSDTRFFRLSDDFRDLIYHEIDFEVNIIAKKDAIQKSTLLTGQRTALEALGCKLFLHAADLRTIANNGDALHDVDPDLPTLLISECCLCYLPPDEAGSVLSYFTGRLNAAVGLIVYEPIRPFDPFGKTMVSNLASRGIHMQTLKRYSSLEAQRQRLKIAGLIDGQGARDVLTIWNTPDWTSEIERERVDRLEWLDEVEEWNLLASHYCIAWGHRGEDFTIAWSKIDGSASAEELSKDQT